MASAIADIVAAGADTLAPLVVIELAIKFYIGAPESNLFAVNAGKIGFAANARAIADIQSLIPHIQLPNIRRVHHRKKIDCGQRLAVRPGQLMGYINNVFVRADAIERWNNVIGQRTGLHLEAPTGVRRPADRALSLGPAQRIQAECRPMILGVATGIDFLLQAQQAQVAGIVRAEARHFDVIAEQIRILGDFIHRAAKKLLLVIEAGAPREVRPNFQILTHAMAEHVRREHAFGRFDIMRATGGVNVMIPGPPAELRWVDPTLDFAFKLPRLRIHFEVFCLGNGFGSAGEFDGIIAIRQFQRFAVSAIDLGMKRKIGGEPLGLRRINSPLRVANDEFCGGGLVVFIADPQRDGAGGEASEKSVHFVAKTDVLRTLADVERDLRFAVSGIAAVELDDAVFERQTAKGLLQRLCVIALQFEPELVTVRKWRTLALLAIELVGGAALRAAAVVRINRNRVGTDSLQWSGRARVVDDFDQKLPPALFGEFGFGRSGTYFDAHFRIDTDGEQAMRIQRALNFLDSICDVFFDQCLLKRSLRLFVQRRTNRFERFGEPPNLGGEGLPIGFREGYCVRQY